MALTFAGRLKDELGLEADVPYNGEAWALPEDARVAEGSRERALSRSERRAAQRAAQEGRLRDEPQPMSPDRADAFRRLTQAADRLNALVRKSDRLNNKTMARLADQILKLTERWSQ